MMVLKDLLHLLYTAHNSYQTLHIRWQYHYTSDGINSLMKRWANQQPIGSFTYIPTASSPQQAQIDYELWRTQNVWRVDYSQLNNQEEKYIQVTKPNERWSYDTQRKKLITNNRQFVSPDSSIHIQYSGAFGRRLHEFQLLDPSFLLATHHFEVEHDTQYVGRPVHVIKATYQRHAEMLHEPFFWATADEYQLLVDREYGILLRYAALIDDTEMAVTETQQVAFNNQIDSSIFSLGIVISE